MRTFIKKMLSGVLAAAMMLSMCAAGIAPYAHAADTDPTGANIALDKSVAFAYGSELNSGDANYNVNAVKAGTSVLTDGENDSPNWWVNNGNPYVALKNSVISGPYIFSVDLGANYAAQQVSVYSYGRPDWSVYPVDAVTYTISADGTSWQTLGTVALVDAIVKTIEDPRYPGQTVDIYEFALPVNAIGRYVRVTFNTNASGLVGLGEFEVYGTKAPENISSGTSVSYFGYGAANTTDANWGVDAVKAGLSVLTDGVSNSPNWWVNNGNPNIALRASDISGPYVFNLNLGTQCSVRQISAYFYSRTDWGVDAPDAVTYSVSTDGYKWTEVGTVEKIKSSYTTMEDSRNPDAQKPSIYKFTLNMDAADAQYVKVIFNTNAVFCIGMQEIEVLGVKKVITNLALNRLSNSGNYTYEVTGGGTGYEASGTTKADGTRYTVSEVENASISRLTDGTVINASAVTYPSSWGSQKWNSSGTIMSKYLQIYRNDSRIITMDLGAMRNITGIRMHFGALEAQGFYMPTNVTYYLSEDGENYYEVADVWNYQATADGNDSNISAAGTAPRHVWYPASGINFNARYVKIIFPVNVYIITDELQVFGSEVLSSDPTALTSCEKYDPLEKYVGHFADQAQSGGVRNEFMAYSGWYINSDGSEVYNTYKTVKEYMTSIAYVDSEGVPQDWLFDDVTVMGHYYTSSGTFNSYKAGYTSGKYYANQSDWYEWLCYAFGKSASGADLSYDGNSVINLEALEEAAGIAKETLNDPDYKVGVKLVLFPAVEYQENWGTIDGKKIDFTISGAGSQEAALANRKAAYQWYVDQAVSMWEKAGFEHLELTGFYYYEETIHESTDRIAKAATQELTKIVHEHATPSTNTKPSFDSRVGGHLYIYQLPFYQSEGYWNWAEYGFDYALMQPNYSFYDMYTLTQLKECADLCKYYGLGMQMEFGGTASQAYIDKFQDYLNYGIQYGYQSSVVSWYMSTWGCYSMAYNSNNTRFLYDMVYEFVKGQTIPTCDHPEHNTDGRCTNCAEEVGHNYVDGVCACGAVEEKPTVPTITLSYPTLSFESEVFYNVYYTAFDVADVEEMGLLTWYNRPANTAAATYDTAEAIIPGAVYNAGADMYMVRSQGVPAKKLGDNMYIRVYAKLSDGTYAYSPVTYYNAKMYAVDILKNSQSAEMKALVVAMLNYGAAAQVHFGHNADNLMNADLTAEQKALVKAYSEDMIGAVITADANKVGTFVSNGGFSNGYPSVSFEGAFSINYYLTPKQTVEGDMTLYCWDLDTYNSVDVLTEENATAKITMTSGGTQYVGSYAGIAAKQIDETVFVAGVYTSGGVRYSSPVISYSLGAYCAEQIAKGSATMQEFAKTTAVYGNYAKAYFASLNG